MSRTASPFASVVVKKSASAIEILPTLSDILSFTSKKTVKAISLDLSEFSQSTLYPPHSSTLNLRSENVAP